MAVVSTGMNLLEGKRSSRNLWINQGNRLLFLHQLFHLQWHVPPAQSKICMSLENQSPYTECKPLNLKPYDMLLSLTQQPLDAKCIVSFIH